MPAEFRSAGLRIKSSLLEGLSSVRHFYYQLHHEMHFSTILWVAKILVPGFSSDFGDRVKPRGADVVGQLISWRVSPRLLFQWQRVSGPGEYAIPTESLKLAIGMMDRKRPTATVPSWCRPLRCFLLIVCSLILTPEEICPLSKELIQKPVTGRNT